MKCHHPRKHWDRRLQSHCAYSVLVLSIVGSCGLRRAGPPPKESYRLSTRFTVSTLILNGHRSEGLILQGRRRSLLRALYCSGNRLLISHSVVLKGFTQRSIKPIKQSSRKLHSYLEHRTNHKTMNTKAHHWTLSWTGSHSFILYSESGLGQ
jgi:hypothetical protein